MADEKGNSLGFFKKKAILGTKGKKAQSAVAMAAGSFDSSDEVVEEQKEKSKRPGKRPGRRKETTTETKRRSRPQNNSGEKKPDVQHVNSKTPIDERLAYYREKYGEDFTPKGE